MHNVHAIILRSSDSDERLVLPSRTVPLPQGYCLIPVDDAYHLAKSNVDAPSVIETFEFLTPEFQAWLATASIGRALAYVETDYFGGHGGQGAVTFVDGVRVQGPAFSHDGPINEALRALGVVTSPDDLDEFEALDLEMHRSTADWLSSLA